MPFLPDLSFSNLAHPAQSPYCLAMPLHVISSFVFMIFMLCVSSAVAFAQGEMGKKTAETYRDLCMSEMENALHPVTASRLCACRANNLTGFISKEGFAGLIDRAGDSAPLAQVRHHASQIVAPCQYIVFQSEVLDHCQSSPAMKLYRDQKSEFCLCYAHVRSMYMKEDMPEDIKAILAKDPSERSPFSTLYTLPSYNDRVKEDILSCLE